MFKPKRKSAMDGVEFCERCSSVCDHACRASKPREQARLSALQQGVRFS
jgi:hypothetical protein